MRGSLSEAKDYSTPDRAVDRGRGYRTLWCAVLSWSGAAVAFCNPYSEIHLPTGCQSPSPSFCQLIDN